LAIAVDPWAAVRTRHDYSADEMISTLQAEAPKRRETIAASLLAAWEWAERPAVVVTVGSRRHPLLVTSLAAGLARIGRLRYFGRVVHDGGS
jgi:hypothetical protein